MFTRRFYSFKKKLKTIIEGCLKIVKSANIGQRWFDPKTMIFIARLNINVWNENYDYFYLKNDMCAMRSKLKTLANSNFHLILYTNKSST
jgi:hypothetical protein